MAFVYEDLYNGRSSLPPYAIVPRPQAVRWEKKKPLTVDNVVIMDMKSAEKHERECLKGDQTVEDVWGKEALAFITRKSVEARRVMEYTRN